MSDRFRRNELRRAALLATGLLASVCMAIFSPARWLGA
jgi:hypothetical protein